MKKSLLLLVLLLLSMLLVACTPDDSGDETDLTPPADTNDDQGDDDDDGEDEATIQFTGVITSINGSVIVVNGISVDTSSASLTGLLVEGATVQVSGVLQPDAVVVAVVIVVVVVEATPESTPPAEGTAEATEPAPESTPIVIDDDAIIIVIEGPVEAININIITIYGINIELDPNDPILTVIQIGDVIRVEGAFEEGDGITIVIVAITIIFIDVDVFILDGEVWRDDGGCQNGPPPWAPAHGWRRRCESGGGGGGSGRGNRGGSS
jgi:hypothetical protein